MRLLHQEHQERCCWRSMKNSRKHIFKARFLGSRSHPPSPAHVEPDPVLKCAAPSAPQASLGADGFLHLLGDAWKGRVDAAPSGRWNPLCSQLTLPPDPPAASVPSLWSPGAGLAPQELELGHSCWLSYGFWKCLGTMEYNICGVLGP